MEIIDQIWKQEQGEFAWVARVQKHHFQMYLTGFTAYGQYLFIV